MRAGDPEFRAYLRFQQPVSFWSVHQSRFSTACPSRSQAAIEAEAISAFLAGLGIAAFCGLRYGEIIGLTRETVDLDGRTIQVRHGFSRFDGLKGPKTASGKRDVLMPPHVAVLLRRWLDEHYLANEWDVLFVTSRGRRLSAAHFHEEMWQPLLTAAGLAEGERFHFHALRHFAASWWIANGLDLPTVAALLGHSKADMTLSI